MLKLPMTALYLRCSEQALFSLFPGCGADTSQMVLGYSQDSFLPHSCWPTHGSCTHYLQALLPVCLALSSSFPQKHWNLLLERKASCLEDKQQFDWGFQFCKLKSSYLPGSFYHENWPYFCIKELQLPKLILFCYSYKSCRYTFIYTTGVT